MSSLDPSHVSEQFASASAGYLKATAAELAQIKAALPRPRTVREQAIYAAVEHGIRNPVEWNARRIRGRSE